VHYVKWLIHRESMLSSQELGSPQADRVPGEKSTPGGADQVGASTHHALKQVLPYERHRANQKAWREKNKEHVKAYMKRWWEANPEKKRAYKYAEKRKATTVELVGLMAAQGGMCALCADSIAVDRHLDHKIPRSRGGENAVSNYQWLCPSCNSAKGAFTNEEFLAHIRKILAHRG
jgi:5-methylcytosine-specific restriction endonuclease McrA